MSAEGDNADSSGANTTSLSHTLLSGGAAAVCRGVGARRANDVGARDPLPDYINHAEYLSVSDHRSTNNLLENQHRMMVRLFKRREGSQPVRLPGERGLVRRLDMFLMTFGCISQGLSRPI